MLEESIINKLESLRLRSLEISDAIAKEGATDDIALYTQLNKEYAEINPIVDLFKSLFFRNKCRNNFVELYGVFCMQPVSHIFNCFYRGIWHGFFQLRYIFF